MSSCVLISVCVITARHLFCSEQSEFLKTSAANVFESVGTGAGGRNASTARAPVSAVCLHPPPPGEVAPVIVLFLPANAPPLLFFFFFFFEVHVCSVHLVQVPVDRAPVRVPPDQRGSCSEETVGFCRSPLHISLHFIMLPSGQHFPDYSREARAKAHSDSG